MVETGNRLLHTAGGDGMGPDHARLTELGAEPFVSSPDEFARFNADYTERWAKVIHAANIRAE